MGEQLGLFGAPAAPTQPACTSWHGEEACCTHCTSTTDGTGFPHPSEAQGRKRYQECKHCSDWVEPEHWVNDIRGAWFGCSWCAYYLNYASFEQCSEKTPAPEKKPSGLGCNRLICSAYYAV